MTVTFRCGHTLTVPATASAAPSCPICRETVVSRVTGAQPRFVGLCRGPFAQFESLAPIVVSLRPAQEK
jgi:hypothetical protein